MGARILLGSVATKVIYLTEIPVALIKYHTAECRSGFDCGICLSQ
jgi:hypothetical protein